LMLALSLSYEGYFACQWDPRQESGESGEDIPDRNQT
jgi:hypothetical protein